MRTAVIVDDEQNAIDMLSISLRDHFSGRIKIIGHSRKFAEGILLVKELNPDLLFLDIDLGDGKSGFDLLKQVKAAGKVPKIIFTTGYHQFAVKALRVQAFDYLLKPVGKQDLEAVWERLEELELESRPPADLEPGVIIRNSDAIYRLPLLDILYFKGNDNYTNVYLRDRKAPILASITLNQFEKEVMAISNRFFRIHKSFLVNLSEVDHIVKEGASRTAVLKNGDRASISRLRYKAFMRAFL